MKKYWFCYDFTPFLKLKTLECEWVCEFSSKKRYGEHQHDIIVACALITHLSYYHRFQHYYSMLIDTLYIFHVKKTRFRAFFIGLGERIRTSGLLNPIQARYKTAPHPDKYEPECIVPQSGIAAQ